MNMSREEILECLDLLAATTQERIDAEQRDLIEITRLRNIVLASKVQAESTQARENRRRVRGVNGSFKLSA